MRPLHETVLYNRTMKITKYEHSCVVIEIDGRKQVIDPGIFSSSFKATDNIDCVIVTHVHPDHFDIEKLKQIRALNPEVAICTVQEVADQAAGLDVEVIDTGRSCAHGPFNTSFFGGKHAVIHSSLPVWQNVGVYVNEKFYYPGDSFTLPDGMKVEVLAVPTIAPWMKISEAMDFIRSVKAKRVFPTHNAILSDIGHTIYNPRLQSMAEESGGTFTFLQPGESIEV